MTHIQTYWHSQTISKHTEDNTFRSAYGTRFGAFVTV